MKKSQEWIIVVAVALLVVGIMGGLFWYLTKDTGNSVVTTAEKTEEQKDLTDVEADLNGIKDLDLSALDAIDEELQEIDLGNL